jgi:hypothetical protein
MTDLITADTRALIEAATGNELSKEEWAAVRQCLRCLTQAKALGLVGGRRKVVGGGEKHSAAKAVALLLAAARDGRVVEAARGLVGTEAYLATGEK